MESGFPGDEARTSETTGKTEDGALKVSFHASPSTTTSFLETFDVVLAAHDGKGFDIL